MFFSRLGEPQRLQYAARVSFAEPDHAAVGPHHRAQADLQAADLQGLALTQANLLLRAELDTRQTLQERR